MPHADIGRLRVFEEKGMKKYEEEAASEARYARLLKEQKTQQELSRTGKFVTQQEYKQRLEAPAPTPTRKVASMEAGDMGTTQIARAAAPRGGAGATQAAIGGGGAMEVAGAGLVGYGAAGHPYALAAGLGLQVIGAGARRRSAERREAQKLEYEAKLERISRQQKALDRLVSIGQGLKNL